MSKEKRAQQRLAAIASQWPGKYARWQLAYQQWKAAGEVGEHPPRPVSPYSTGQKIILPVQKEDWEL